MRLIRGCHRDLEVYERNRERIADIADPTVRSQIYTCMVRVTMAIEGVLAETETLVSVNDAIEDARTNGSGKLDDLVRDRDARSARRDSSFDFMVSTMNETCAPLSARLRDIAKSPTGNIADIVAANAAPPSRKDA